MRPTVFTIRLIPIVIGISFLSIHGIANQEPTSGGTCRQSQPGTRHNRSGDEPIIVSMKELERHPEDYYGKTVTVDGEFHRIFSDNVFTIENSSFFEGTEILVISTVPKADAVVPLQDSLKPGKDVRVTGVVQPFDRGKLECAYGPLHLESHEGQSFTRNPVLIVGGTI